MLEELNEKPLFTDFNEEEKELENQIEEEEE